MKIKKGHALIDAQLAEISHEISCDFCTATGNQKEWGGNAIASGTLTSGIGTAKHFGVLQYVSSTSANSGYSFTTSSSAILFVGGEKFNGIIKTATTLTGVTRRIGFHDTGDQSAPTDGVYIKILDGVLTGQTVNSGTISTTSTNLPVQSDTWYELKIELNVDATLATFTVYADDSDTVLWTDNLATNIPKTVGRETSCRDVCTYSGTSAINIGYIDYMRVIFPNTRKVH